MALRDSFRFLLPVLLLVPDIAHGQTTEQPSPAFQQREEIEQQVRELREQQQALLIQQEALLKSMQQQTADFDARMAALEAKLGITPPKSEVAQTTSDVRDSTAMFAPPSRGVAEGRSSGPYGSEAKSGSFEPGKGFVLARGPNGELDFGVNGYVRYLNQGALDPTYTDAFGRTFVLDKRQDIQLNRLQLNFRGWLFDEALRYHWYVWTQNVSQGDPAQVVVGGNLSYKFSDALKVTTGIFSLPSTRSTNLTYPNWLRIDNRTMADEFFRGSYTTGILAGGKITDTLAYNVALANNLSQLGVSASQLDFGLNTVSGFLWWMPTTGEFGPTDGFGDYEYHEELATLLGVHFTHSREDRQSQPGVNAFENSQIRLSDGTLLFSPNAFNTGGTINQATYKMLDLDAGLKFKGWSLEGEYYFRWVDDFHVIGTIPVTSLFDQGFQLQVSTMLKPNYLQAYVSGSKIFGEYGDPWDAAVGLTYFPLGRKQVRINTQALYMDRSAIGYTAVPYVVGGNGWVFTADFGTWF